MANRIVGNTYIIDSGTIALTDGLLMRVNAVALWSIDTSGELWLTYQSNTADTAVRIRNNQSQPFMLPQYLGGVQFKDLRVQVLTAGTGFLYLV